MENTPSFHILEYIVMLVSEFAQRFSMTPRQAYRYIRRFDGVRLIEDNYGIMHTLTFADAVDGVAKYCALKGGELK